MCCFPSPTNHKSKRFPLLLEVFEAGGGVTVFLVFLSAVDWPQILRWPQIPRPPSWFHTQSWVSPNKQAVGWKYLLRTPIVLTVLHYESHSRQMCKLPFSLETLGGHFGAHFTSSSPRLQYVGRHTMCGGVLQSEYSSHKPANHRYQIKPSSHLLPEQSPAGNP